MEIPKTHRISPSDTVSGAFYLRLVADFKAYEQALRREIRLLQTDLDFVEFENPDAAALLKMRRERDRYREKYNQSKEDNARLIGENHLLRTRLREAREL